MAKIVVVVAHPNPESLCRALAAAAVYAAEAAGASVCVHDLHADGFDPLMKVGEVGTTAFADPLAERYATELKAADGIVVVHPVWFFHAPASLKGWVERVVREGVAFDVSPAGEITGLLRARRALVVTTANGSLEVEREVFGDPVGTFWERVVFGPAGVERVERLAFSPVRGSDDAQRAAWLATVADSVAEMVSSPVADLRLGEA